MNRIISIRKYCVFLLRKKNNLIFGFNIFAVNQHRSDASPQNSSSGSSPSMSHSSSSPAPPSSPSPQESPKNCSYIYRD